MRLETDVLLGAGRVAAPLIGERFKPVGTEKSLSATWPGSPMSALRLSRGKYRRPWNTVKPWTRKGAPLSASSRTHLRLEKSGVRSGGRLFRPVCAVFVQPVVRSRVVDLPKMAVVPLESFGPMC